MLKNISKITIMIIFMVIISSGLFIYTSCDKSHYWSVLAEVSTTTTITTTTTTVTTTTITTTSTTTTAYYEQMIQINAKGDSFDMGDGVYGPTPMVTQTISYNFKMSKYEVTNGWFARAMADGLYSNSSYWTTNGWSVCQSSAWTQPLYMSSSNFNGTDQPVVGVSWYESVAFCNWLSAKKGFNKAYDDTGYVTLTATGYRLPTEVEWEYASAKGSVGAVERTYASGSGTLTCSMAVSSIPGCGATKPANVGSKTPGGDTPQGLCDMSGNVREWCNDIREADNIVQSRTNRYIFTDDTISSMFLVRGGSWGQNIELLFRGAARYDYNSNTRYNDIGFRILLP